MIFFSHEQTKWHIPFFFDRHHITCITPAGYGGASLTHRGGRLRLPAEAAGKIKLEV